MPKKPGSKRPESNNLNVQKPDAKTSDRNWVLALANCAQEPVHIPGNIQSFGALIATDSSLEKITHTSANLVSVLGQDKLGQDHAEAGDAAESLTHLLGQSLDTIFSAELIHELANAAGLPTITQYREHLGAQVVQGQLLDISIHYNGTRMLIELETSPMGRERLHVLLRKVKSILDQLPDSSAMLSHAVESLRHITGFDRVMAYKFLQDQAGEVVAEACPRDLEPYLGLRYPESDIPSQVRTLALKQPLRIISNIHEPPVPILSLDPAEAPLDLSLAFTRAVSPIHLEYLRNMGVEATMNISITISGQLWGLFAFHHRQPKLISQDLRAAIELFGQLFSLKFEQVMAEEHFRSRKRAASTLNQIVTQQVPDENWQITVTQSLPKLSQLLFADGAALMSDQALLASDGDTPTETAILALVAHSQSQMAEIVTIQSLQQINLSPPDRWKAQIWNSSAGALIFTIHSTLPLYLVFFRNQIISELRWGGNPENKDIVQGVFGPRLRPRASFEEYKETVKDRCRPWDRHDLAAAMEIRSDLLRLIENRVHDFQQRQQNLLIAELNHRVKNILALIRSIARRTYESTDSLANYTQTLEQRISALALAHDLVAGNQLEWPSIKSLFEIELRPYLLDKELCISIMGQEAGLKANFVPTFVLVIHELTSNAVKYGALTSDPGKLSIQWFEADGGLSLKWQEFTSFIVNEPQHRGFGRDLIERALPYEFEGEAALRFLPAGIEAEFWIPGDLIRWHPASDSKAKSRVNKSKTIAEVNSNTEPILIVEDNMLLAMELEQTLKNQGFDQIDSAPSVTRALKLLTQKRYQFCLLDIDLKTETSFKVAYTLLKQQIPFAFTTGYNSKHPVPKDLSAAPMIKKPIDVARLLKVLQENLNVPPSV